MSEILEQNLSEKYDEIINKLYILFKEKISKQDCKKILLTTMNIKSFTIFEFFNAIYRNLLILYNIKIQNTEKFSFSNSINDNSIKENSSSEEYLNQDDLNTIINEYKILKTFNENENNSSNYRRKIQILHDKDNFPIYNYLPIKKEFPIKSLNQELYSKNDYEYLFHPLFYKTIICQYCQKDSNFFNEKSKSNLCPYSHNIQTDFRIIYDYKNDYIKKLLNYIYINYSSNFIDFMQYIPIERNKFDLGTFKIYKCEYDKNKNCKKDIHLCQFYHSSEKFRRPPYLFRYSNKKNYAKNSCYNSDKCEFGIFCNFVHNKNEFNYHPLNFRKNIKCSREKENGQCIYIETCYGIHPDEEYKIKQNKKVDEKLIEENEEIKTLSNKIKMANDVIENFKCKHCDKLSKNEVLYYFLDCNHFLCYNCYEDIKKHSDNEKNFKCPFCEKVIEKNKYIKIHFKEKK